MHRKIGLTVPVAAALSSIIAIHANAQRCRALAAIHRRLLGSPQRARSTPSAPCRTMKVTLSSRARDWITPNNWPATSTR